MEDLNKQQLILLVILVSFVTSIATGIITVSLLDKAPVEVKQTINRVVERTVETVVPEDIQPEERVVTVRETVVVSREDQVVEAISKSKDSIVRVLNSEGTVVSMGIIRSANGEVITVDSSSFSQSSTYSVRLANNEEYDLEFLNRDESGIAYFRIQNANREFVAGSFMNNTLQLGQTVVAISGSDRNIVSSSFVSDLPGSGQIVTDLDLSSMITGTIMLNLSGDVVGILTRQGVFRSVETLLALEEEVDTSNAASASGAVN